MRCTCLTAVRIGNSCHCWSGKHAQRARDTRRLSGDRRRVNCVQMNCSRLLPHSVPLSPIRKLPASIMCNYYNYYVFSPIRSVCGVPCHKLASYALVALSDIHNYIYKGETVTPRIDEGLRRADVQNSWSISSCLSFIGGGPSAEVSS